MASSRPGCHPEKINKISNGIGNIITNLTEIQGFERNNINNYMSTNYMPR